MFQNFKQEILFPHTPLVFMFPWKWWFSKFEGINVSSSCTTPLILLLFHSFYFFFHAKEKEMRKLKKNSRLTKLGFTLLMWHCKQKNVVTAFGNFQKIMCGWTVWIFLPPKCFLFSARSRSAITTAVSLLPEGTFFYPSSRTSSNQLLLTPAACMCRVPLRLAPMGLIWSLWGWKGTSNGRWPAPPKSDFSLITCCLCATYFLAMWLGLQDAAAKELQREVAAHSGFNLSFRCCPRKWEGAAVSAFPSGAIPVLKCHSLWLVPSYFSPATGAKQNRSPVSSRHPSLGKINGWHQAFTPAPISAPCLQDWVKGPKCAGIGTMCSRRLPGD